jgi:hypothetical protein
VAIVYLGNQVTHELTDPVRFLVHALQEERLDLDRDDAVRLSGWRRTAPTVDSMSADVLAMLKPVLADLGADADPTCWVVWGEDPEARYSILVPTVAGLITAAIRTANQGGTPRATAKLVRWPKLSVSELNLESNGEHRIIVVQVETLYLKGVDEEADRICEFVRDLIAEIDDRHAPQAPIAYFAAGAVEASAAPAPAAAVPQRPPLPERVPAAAPAAIVAPANEEPTRTAPPTPVEVPAADAQPVVATAAPAAAASAARLAPATEPAASALAAKAAPAPKPRPARAEPAAATHTPLGPAVKPVAAKPTAPGTGLVHVPGPATAAPAPRARSAREEPETELDRSKWIPPHPVGHSAPHKPAKPRPWRP